MKHFKKAIKYGSAVPLAVVSTSVFALDVSGFTTAMTAGEADVAAVALSVLNFVVLLFVLAKVRQIGKA